MNFEEETFSYFSRVIESLIRSRNAATSKIVASPALDLLYTVFTVGLTQGWEFARSLIIAHFKVQSECDTVFKKIECECFARDASESLEKFVFFVCF